MLVVENDGLPFWCSKQRLNLRFRSRSAINCWKTISPENELSCWSSNRNWGRQVNLQRTSDLLCFIVRVVLLWVLFRNSILSQFNPHLFLESGKNPMYWKLTTGELSIHIQITTNLLLYKCIHTFTPLFLQDTRANIDLIYGISSWRRLTLDLIGGVSLVEYDFTSRDDEYRLEFGVGLQVTAGLYRDIVLVTLNRQIGFLGDQHDLSSFQGNKGRFALMIQGHISKVGLGVSVGSRYRSYTSNAGDFNDKSDGILFAIHVSYWTPKLFK